MTNFFNRQNIQKKRVQEPKSLLGISGKIDYKNVILLRNFITFEGKIVPRRVSKLSAKQQRYMSRAIKNARLMGLLPFINKQRPTGQLINQ